MIQFFAVLIMLTVVALWFGALFALLDWEFETGSLLAKAAVFLWVAVPAAAIFSIKV